MYRCACPLATNPRDPAVDAVRTAGGPAPVAAARFSPWAVAWQMCWGTFWVGGVAVVIQQVPPDARVGHRQAWR